MVYVETTHESWFGRMGNAIKGVIFGLILVMIAIPLLFWNEGRAVKTAKALKEGAASVITVDSAKIESANEGKLVHFTGNAINAGEKLTDATFNVSTDALRLRRIVEMYQWKENKKTDSHDSAVGGSGTQTTTYTYEQAWQKDPIDSASFKETGHTNPTNWRLQKNYQDASRVTVGAYALNPELVGSIDDFTPVTLPPDASDKLTGDLKDDAVFTSNTLYFSNQPSQKPNPASPQIGDLRVLFQVALPGEVSVIARQTGTTLTPFQTKTEPIQFLYVGDHTAQEMFKAEEKKNETLSWILRGVGFVMIWIGLALIFAPMRAVADVVSIIGDIVGAGIGIVTFFMAVAIAFTVIAIAWIAFRPVVGISLLFVAIAAIVGIFMLRSRGRRPESASGRVTIILSARTALHFV